MLFYRRLRYGCAFRKIPLTQGKFAIVDPQDYPHLSKYKWRLCRTKGKNVLYAERSIHLPNGKYSRILMHRQLIDCPEGHVIDHVNTSGLDNRRANLRNCTTMQNTWNSKPEKGATSPYKGVSWCKAMRQWEAGITVQGRRIQLGFFDDEIEAAQAYDRAARQHFGPYAYLNFPNQTET